MASNGQINNEFAKKAFKEKWIIGKSNNEYYWLDPDN